MRVKILAPATGNDTRQYLVSYLVNDTLAIGAGFIGFYKTPHEQAQIQHLLLQNTRSSNVASLPIFVENAYEPIPDCVTIHATNAVLAAIQKDIFNDRVWPDFIALSNPKAPFLKTVELPPERPSQIDGLTVISLEVSHGVPSCAFMVENDSAAVLFIPETGPTTRVWEQANSTATLRAVFVQVSLPDERSEQAERQQQLTPALLAQELEKLTVTPSIYAVPVHSIFAGKIVQQLAAHGIAVAQPDHEYQFN